MGNPLWMNEGISDCYDLLPIMNTKESLDEPEVTLAPNPVRNILEISWSTENRWSKVIVENLQGYCIHSQKINIVGSRMSLDTSLWPKGLYILVLIDEEGRYVSRKVVRQ